MAVTVLYFALFCPGIDPHPLLLQRHAGQPDGGASARDDHLAGDRSGLPGGSGGVSGHRCDMTRD